MTRDIKNTYDKVARRAFPIVLAMVLLIASSALEVYANTPIPEFDLEVQVKSPCSTSKLGLECVTRCEKSTFEIDCYRSTAHLINIDTTIPMEYKLKQGNFEMNWFESMTSHIQFDESVINYNDANGANRTYLLYEDRRDPNLREKRAGVIKGIQILIDRGIEIPADLKVYLSEVTPLESQPECCDAEGKLLFIKAANGAMNAKCMTLKTIAFKRDRNFQQLANVIISTVIPTPGALSGTRPTVGKYGVLDKTTITIIHEIGHILHERYAGDLFWTKDFSKKINKGTTNVITEYGSNNKKEFVAEVFAALVLGLPSLNIYSSSYKKFRGPHPELFLGTGGLGRTLKSKVGGGQPVAGKVDMKSREFFCIDKANQIYDVKWDHLLQMKNVPETKGISCWSAASATLVMAADRVLYNRLDIETKKQYWSQFKTAFDKNDKGVFEIFKLNITQQQLGTPDQLLDFLIAHGPFAIGLENQSHARVVTGMFYNKKDNTCRVKIFDPRKKGTETSAPINANNSGDIYEQSFQEFINWNKKMANATNASSSNPMLTLAHFKK